MPGLARKQSQASSSSSAKESPALDDKATSNQESMEELEASQDDLGGDLSVLDNVAASLPDDSADGGDDGLNGFHELEMRLRQDMNELDPAPKQGMGPLPTGPQEDLELGGDTPQGPDLFGPMAADAGPKAEVPRGVDPNDPKVQAHLTRRKFMKEDLVQGGTNDIVATMQAYNVHGTDKGWTDLDKDAKKGDDVYLKRTFKKNKKYNSDADNEFANTADAKLLPGLDKLRKLSVRSTESMDDYTHTVMVDQAQIQASWHKLFQERQDALKALTDAVDAQESKDMARSADNAFKEERKKADKAATLLKSTETGQAKAKEALPFIQKGADFSHDVSQKVVKFEDEVKARGDDAGDKQSDDKRYEALRGEVDKTLNLRRAGKQEQTSVHQVVKALKKEGVIDDSWGRFFKKGAKKFSAMGAGLAMGFLTGGLIDGDVRDVDGGTKIDAAPRFLGFVDQFREVRAECGQLDKAKAMGGKRASAVYNTLKTLTGSVLPSLRKVAMAIAFWATVFAGPSLGASLPVAAGAGTIALTITAVKLALEIIMTVWSKKRLMKTNDRNARKNKLVRAEHRTNKGNLVQDATSLVMSGALSTDAQGQSMSVGDAVQERFDDFGNQAGNLHGQVADTNLDDYGLIGGWFGAAAVGGVRAIGDQAKSKDSKAEIARKDEVGSSGVLSGNIPANQKLLPENTQMGKSARPEAEKAAALTSRMQNRFDKLVASSKKAAGKAKGDDKKNALADLDNLNVVNEAVKSMPSSPDVYVDDDVDSNDVEADNGPEIIFPMDTLD